MKHLQGDAGGFFISLTDSLCHLWEFVGIMTSKTLYESKMKTLALLH